MPFFPNTSWRLFLSTLPFFAENVTAAAKYEFSNRKSKYALPFLLEQNRFLLICHLFPFQNYKSVPICVIYLIWYRKWFSCCWDFWSWKSSYQALRKLLLTVISKLLFLPRDKFQPRHFYKLAFFLSKWHYLQ